MGKNPLVSVIVPVYNGEDYLEKCVERIENQTYDNLEVLIVNDGSRDKTAQICEGLALRYKNIRLLTLCDEGVSAARNAGLEAAQGEYVTFVDADDGLLPDMVAVLYQCIERTGADVAGCGFFIWKEEQEFAHTVCKAGREEDIKVYQPAEFFEQEVLKGNSRCWSKLYKRSSIDSLRFRKGLTIGEDMLFLVDLLLQIKALAEVDYKGYGYFRNPKGAMGRAFRPDYMDQISCWEIAREKTEDIAALAKECQADRLAQMKCQVTVLLIMAIMLTAGKIARLSGRERKKQAEYIGICRDKIRKELQASGAYNMLPLGYKVKAKLFAGAPAAYLWLYHFRSERKQ